MSTTDTIAQQEHEEHEEQDQAGAVAVASPDGDANTGVDTDVNVDPNMDISGINTDTIPDQDDAVSLQQQKQIEQEATLARLTEGVMTHGHRMTMSEALAVVIKGDRSHSREVYEEYAKGENKVILDAVCRRLREAGWTQRKTQRFGSRRIRWINPVEDN